jgi:hypothetical protein
VKVFVTLLTGIQGQRVFFSLLLPFFSFFFSLFLQFLSSFFLLFSAFFLPSFSSSFLPLFSFSFFLLLLKRHTSTNDELLSETLGLGGKGLTLKYTRAHTRTTNYLVEPEGSNQVWPLRLNRLLRTKNY